MNYYTVQAEMKTSTVLTDALLEGTVSPSQQENMAPLDHALKMRKESAFTLLFVTCSYSHMHIPTHHTLYEFAAWGSCELT